eukprot:CAMPEP_0119332690 /NCGR_PEP_ID=MMETSP1333-20130426/83319_1 /TAXON_ID=418940 /ORGANISM="Scyphosphaera apsteinii, Strain RCC1455" /LENGTH=36 /DNA_ID= /DNA_START= /DNA_END= /DNA_ORIENTATION=
MGQKHSTGQNRATRALESDQTGQSAGVRVGLIQRPE